MIHSTAVISPDAKIASDVEIGPYAIVEGDAQLNSGCRLSSHAIVRGGSILEENVHVDSFAVVGGDPQDFKFDPSMPSGVKLGKGCKLREGATIHRSTRENEYTVLGEEVFMMCNSHVGHDCVVENNVIMANNVSLGGEVAIGAFAFIGGGTVVHQFVRVGESVMLSGYSAASRDVPPFITLANRNVACGLNMIGMKRRGFSSDELSEIKRAYRAIYFHQGNPEALAQAALEQQLVSTDRGLQFLDFFKESRIGGYVSSRKKSGA